MRITESKLRSVIRQVILEEEMRQSRPTMPMTAADYEKDEREAPFEAGSEEDKMRSEEKQRLEAERKQQRIRSCSKNSFLRNDGRKVFTCDGEQYCADTMLPMWVFDGKSLGQHFKDVISSVKSFF